MQHAPAIRQPVPFATKFLYGIGQMGGQVFRDTPAVLLPVFMITMLGIPAWMSGLVVLLPKLWVIVCDPLMGNLSDRIEPRRGRAPLLLAGALAASAGFAALFAFNGYSSPDMAAAAICVMFLLASTGFSAFSVPYLALAAELSEDSHERTRILVYRMVFTIAGVLLGVGIAQPLVFWMGGGAAGWRGMGFVLGVTICLSMVATALGFWRFRADTVTAGPISLLAQLRVAARNRPFRLLTAMQFVLTLAQACGYSVVGLVFLYPIGNIALLPAFVIVMSVAGLLSQPFWMATSARHGKLTMFVVATLGWTAVTFSWFLVGSAGDAAIAVPVMGAMPVEQVLVLVRGFVIGFFNSGFVLLAISMLTDTINHGRENEATPADGALAGIFSATEKLAFAVGPAIGGVILSAMGLQSSTGGAIVQSAAAIRGILLLYSVIPGAFALLSLLFLRNYRRSFQR
jgi:GPH family glycoside/pentoside/hexuronide:cation symporter